MSMAWCRTHRESMLPYNLNVTRRKPEMTFNTIERGEGAKLFGKAVSDASNQRRTQAVIFLARNFRSED